MLLWFDWTILSFFLQLVNEILAYELLFDEWAVELRIEVKDKRSTIVTVDDSCYYIHPPNN